ncbi:MAG: adenylosuccinate lyase [Acidimicrobiia bacterium]|nr:adenylosuccinate lyase [Acidimicrobiia bacterium]
MIERYSLPEMAALWDERHKIDPWAEIEALVLEGWEAEGVVPAGAATEARAVPPIDLDAWKAREAEIHHDLAAFVDVMAAAMPEHGRWLHYGLTSSDVLDTALGVTLREASAMLLDRVIALFEAVRQQAIAHRETAMAGRSHGIWAEPTTFGHKMAGFGFELARAHQRLTQASHTVSYGTISGPVGNHSTVPPSVESHVVEALGLRAEPAATQVVARDRHAAFLSALAGVGATVERLAVEIRHLARSEVSEVAERFAAGQKGSSAMPHKRNPILSENVSGLARLLRGYAVAGLEDVALWHERDMSHSSVERVALPDACLVLDFMLSRMTRVVEGLAVDADRMRANLEASNGLVFSQAALNALIRSGMGRDEAYRIVQEAATRATDAGAGLQQELAADPRTEAAADRLLDAFDLTSYLAHAGHGVDHLEKVTADWLRSGASS